MSALDFMLGCLGVSTVLVGIAFSVKILSDVRVRGLIARNAKTAVAMKQEEPLDPMNQRLQELRAARFGRPMDRSVTLASQPEPPQFKQRPQTSGFRRRQNE